ncbi:16S rRNA (cytidine(1402)-2'-O)-methyltransferase [Marinobacter salicampi]|uniref:16S rRNA (cytidine(1402)-2'-O)-methyltransferase n=1 Tax=Marinobacter salicampi TaxID=435907 RepID=UPI0014085A02|nr:16S rRNA (cytidine(1402)-2'-O)-methyltransferase [Marinobacter salicampi]
MNPDSAQTGPKKEGVLYIVATPIGNLDDLSPRAISVISQADVIAAEDTRHTGRLLQHLGLKKTMMAIHDHNERDKAGAVVDKLVSGASIALVSDAGTPLISDPGYVLVRQARQSGVRVVPVPGPCALVAALSAAGLATDRFLFEGFLPAKRGARKAALEDLAGETATLIFYESPHRILETASAISEVMGAGRQVVLARELTKAFETFYSGSAADICDQLAADPYATKGEFVVMVEGAEASAEAHAGLDVDKFLRLLLAELPVKKVAQLGSELTGLAKNDLYQRALTIKNE